MWFDLAGSFCSQGVNSTTQASRRELRKPSWMFRACSLLETSDSSQHAERMYVNTRDFKNCVTSQTMTRSHHVRQNSAAVINLRTNNGAGRRPTCLSSPTTSCWCIFNKVGETAHHWHLSLLTLFTCLSLLSLSISCVSISVTRGEVVTLLLVCVSQRTKLVTSHTCQQWKDKENKTKTWIQNLIQTGPLGY